MDVLPLPEEARARVLDFARQPDSLRDAAAARLRSRHGWDDAKLSGAAAWRGKSGGTRLMESLARAADDDEARSLVALGVDAAAANAGGVTALHLAAQRGFVALIGELVAAGACVDARTTYTRESPLVSAVCRRQAAAARALLEAGADADLECKLGTPRTIAAGEPDLADIVELFAGA